MATLAQLDSGAEQLATGDVAAAAFLRGWRTDTDSFFVLRPQRRATPIGAARGQLLVRDAVGQGQSPSAQT